MTTHWYALHVKRHKERSVHRLLLAREIEVFFPSLRVKPKNPRSAKERPYFPGYMFVNANLEIIGINAFSWLPGTRGLVAFGGEPAVVPVNLIQELKQRLAQLQIEGELPGPAFKKGERVRIVSGPFDGYEAIFDTHLSGKERVQVLLSFLSTQPKPVKLDAADIEKIK